MRLTGRRHGGSRQDKTADTQTETVVAASNDAATGANAAAAAGTTAPPVTGTFTPTADPASANAGDQSVSAMTAVVSNQEAATESGVSPHSPTTAPAFPAAPVIPDFLDLIAADPTSLESVAFECLINRLADARVTSLMHVLGWPDDAPCFAVAGRPPHSVAVTATLDRLREAARDLGGTLAIAGIHDGMAAIVVAMQAAATGEVACTTMAAAFADDSPIALGPVRHGVDGAIATLHAALHTMTAAPALAVGAPTASVSVMATAAPTVSPMTAPMVIRADDALPERALLGDADARRELVDVVYASLTESGPDDPTLGTVSTFLFSGGSLEVTAKTIGVHPNTVRYRLKRAADTTGWDATDPREAYVLRTAIALGRMTGV